METLSLQDRLRLSILLGPLPATPESIAKAPSEG